jgi:hypothetical protein
VGEPERETEREIAERENPCDPKTHEETRPEAELPVELEDPTEPDSIFGEQRRDFRWIVGRLS